MALSLAPGANALDTAEIVKERMEEFARFCGYDTAAAFSATLPFDSSWPA